MQMYKKIILSENPQKPTFRYVKLTDKDMKTSLKNFLLIFVLASNCEPSLADNKARNDTLLVCYTCMDQEHTLVREKCPRDRVSVQTCYFGKAALLNWEHVKQMLEYEVVFQCLLLYYKDIGNATITSKRGCVGEYIGFRVCDHMNEIYGYDEGEECILCNKSKCNIEFDPLPAQTLSTNRKSNSLLLLLACLLLQWYQ